MDKIIGCGAFSLEKVLELEPDLMEPACHDAPLLHVIPRCEAVLTSGYI